MDIDCRSERVRGVGPTVASSDAALVAAIAEGDQGALAEVVTREGRRILAVAATVCGSDRAEDVTQEVLAALWQRPGRFDPTRGTLRSFLVLQARSRATDVIRSDGSRSRRERRTSDTIDATRQRGRGHQVEDEVISRTDGEAIQRVLAGIPDTEREVITLAYFGVFTYREVAAILGRPEGTVKSQIRNGLSRLRAILDHDDPFLELAASQRAGAGVGRPRQLA